jgi:hypothetical protein
MRALVLACLVVLAAGCGGTETVTVTQTETRTETQTETETRTETVESAVGLPAPVADKHAAILAAAESGDYEQLRPLIPEQFSYSFGAGPPGGAIEYWQQVEEQSGERPIEILARILRMPYTLYRGTYVWPFAYDKQPDELTRHERRILGDLADDFGAGTGYLGWRAGISPSGEWQFFIAGD